MRKHEYLTEDHSIIKGDYRRNIADLHDNTEHRDIRQRHKIVKSRVVPQHWSLSSQNEHPADLQHGVSYTSEKIGDGVGCAQVKAATHYSHEAGYGHTENVLAAVVEHKSAQRHDDD